MSITAFPAVHGGAKSGGTCVLEGEEIKRPFKAEWAVHCLCGKRNIKLESPDCFPASEWRRLYKISKMKRLSK